MSLILVDPARGFGPAVAEQLVKMAGACSSRAYYGSSKALLRDINALVAAMAEARKLAKG